MFPTFDLQGHRGARGVKPENTLPSFEIALDACVTSIETDLHLTHDRVPILHHDAHLPASLDPDCRAIANLSLRDLQQFAADKNPDPQRFSHQDARPTPVAEMLTRQWSLSPFAIPSLANLLAFVDAYAGDLGEKAGKTVQQRQHAQTAILDLELKRVPYYPDWIGDDFDGSELAALEKESLRLTTAWKGRITWRSFDHRCLYALKQTYPQAEVGVLIAETCPVRPMALACDVDARSYYPDYRFLDERQVRQCHQSGVRVVPWTVNEEVDWERLISWGVDGLTTDYPDRLAHWLRRKTGDVS